MATRRKKTDSTQSRASARPRSASSRRNEGARAGTRSRQREAVPMSARGKKGSE